MKQSIIISCILFVACTNLDQVQKDIRSQLDEMQNAFAQKDLLQVAQFYGDECYMIGPNGIISQGRNEVDTYWRRIKNPISWKLEDFGTFGSLNGLVNSKAYVTLQNKPPLWDHLDIELDQNAIYQVGRSTLVRATNGIEYESIVNFILVWQKIDHSYKVVLDSYIRAQPQ